jgi:hypothetical protein
VLTERLRMLERVGVLDRGLSPDGHVVYLPTDMGLGLRDVIRVTSAWGERWLEPAPEQYEGALVLWQLTHLLEADDLPTERVVVRFDIDDARRQWLLAGRPRAEVRDARPAAVDHLVITTTSEWLTKWFVGRVFLTDAERFGHITVTGPPDRLRMLDRWGGLGSWIEPHRDDRLIPVGAAAPAIDERRDAWA